MSSHEEQIHAKAGETKGQAQVKTEQMIGKGREATEAAKEKAAGGAQAAREQTEEKGEQTGGFCRKRLKPRRRRRRRPPRLLGSGLAGPRRAPATRRRPTASDQVRSAAQGAAEAVKGTLGMGGERKEGANE
ncbi:unnamed protein product [Spirodela intermedia]|uniref:Uncharacterized protein n=1 Tax=Spirodela intermedia TaxID=51605 RepID=A0A7I8IUG8_SPIIN|nr:unnamed protein product [Spirodela intermedia]CAA6660803.1 unnamed protein product [Spirodela intermedia]